MSPSKVSARSCWRFLLLTAFTVLCADASAARGRVVATNAVERLPELPDTLVKMGLHTARTLQLTNGVMYYYGRFEALYGYRNDLHLLRVDYRNSPVQMKFVDNTSNPLLSKRVATSKVAAEQGAAFAVNGTFEGGSLLSPSPQGFTKCNGIVIPSGEPEFGGLAISYGKNFSFSPTWNAANSKSWENVITSEAYGLHNGRLMWSSSFAEVFGFANYTFAGMTPDGVIWLGVVDGRRPGVSEGLNYYYVCKLLQDLGCSEGMCMDGGGSSTLVIRKDLLPGPDVAMTQLLSEYSGDYYTMNSLADGHERPVINQLLFVLK